MSPPRIYARSHDQVVGLYTLGALGTADQACERTRLVIAGNATARVFIGLLDLAADDDGVAIAQEGFAVVVDVGGQRDLLGIFWVPLTSVMY